MPQKMALASSLEYSSTGKPAIFRMPSPNSSCLTYSSSLAASFGTILLAGGAPGRRFALGNATIHMHQPLGGAQGQATDIQIQANEILRLRQRVEEVLVHHTGQPADRIRTDLDRDIYLEPAQAMEYGLIDGILDQTLGPTTNGASS